MTPNRKWALDASCRLLPQELLALESVSASLPVTEPSHYLIYGKGSELNEPCSHANVLRAAAERIAEVRSGVLISARILCSPPQSGDAQPWHLDYAMDVENVETVFIALTASNPASCTEILDFGTENERIAQLAREAFPLGLASCQWRTHAVNVEKVLLDPGQAAVVQTGTFFHRRSATDSAAHVRITFNVDVCPRGENAQRFACVDAAKASLTGSRIVEKCSIDDFSEQDVFLAS